ncbi:hypothetical protein Leryth_021238 [Lithospermum erythrorhizon]|nr:hypothetical protein Leryth_021238 [Lithospermum erythrorhizon]
MRLLRTMWLSLCNLMNQVSIANERALREKAIMVAGRVSIVNDGNRLKASCPVCLEAMCTPFDSDLKMVLALHMSLWHPDDVNLQWDIMTNKKESNIHVPSFALGLGVAAGISVFLAFVGKNKTRALANTDQKVVFKWK